MLLIINFRAIDWLKHLFYILIILMVYTHLWMHVIWIKNINYTKLHINLNFYIFIQCIYYYIFGLSIN